MFEHRSRPLAPHGVFLRRVASSVAAASLIVAGSLLVGVLGYRYLVGEAWIDAFLDAAMILSGMGPVTQHEKDPAGEALDAHRVQRARAPRHERRRGPPGRTRAGADPPR